MGDENPIRTLGDYSKPSHEGYKNTIELPAGNNMVLLRSDTKPSHEGYKNTIDAHSMDFGSITTWEDLTTRFLAQFFPLGRTAKLRNDILMGLRKLRPDKAWATIERLAQYEDEGGNDALTPDEVNLNFKNPDIEKLLGVKERKVDALMTNAISLMKKSKNVFRLTTNEIYQPPFEPSRQEEFEHIMTNFILDQEKRITQLEDYMYDPLHKGVTFRLGGEEREMPLLEFGWRVGLYSKRESRDVATHSGLRNAETVNATHFTHMFWPTIGDGGYNVGNMKAKSIRNPRIKLAHRCITMTITGRKETTNRVTDIDLFYLNCIFG
ncbi:hypothetical protein Tco_0736536 [Tanacetum coccineum]